MKADWRAHLDAEFEIGVGLQAEQGRLARRPLVRAEIGRAKSRTRAAAIPASTLEELREIGKKITAVPQGFHVHKTIQRFLDNRAKAIETGEGIDWSTAEALAFCTLLKEGHPVRLSGQD